MRDAAIVLLVEDRPDDVLLMIRSFKQAGIQNRVEVVTDGEQALQYLSGEGKYSDRDAFPLPELVLLDLKLPKIDGFEVLRWIRLNPALTGLRVVVLTSSADVRDVNAAYSLGANSFLVKPADFSSYLELTEFISENWFHFSATPDLKPADSNLASETARRNKKVLLRDRHSRRFYAGHHRWVAQKQHSLDFERIELAEAVASAERLKEVEIILAYEEPDCELTVPIAFPGVRRT